MAHPSPSISTGVPGSPASGSGPSPSRPSGWSIRWRRTPSVSRGVPGGGTMVYSGDTGPSEALVQLAAGVDLLLVESAFLDGPDNPAGMHLSGPQAADDRAGRWRCADRAHPHPAVVRTRSGLGRGNASLRRAGSTREAWSCVDVEVGSGTTRSEGARVSPAIGWQSGDFSSRRTQP